MTRSIVLVLCSVAGLASSWCSSSRGIITTGSRLAPFFLMMSAAGATPGATESGNSDEGVLALPELPPASDDKSETRQLELGGSLSMDELGPIIINPDGTTRRITNWDTLSAQEKKSSWRLIGKRNKERLEKLKQEKDKIQDKDKAQGEGEGEGEGEGKENSVKPRALR